MFNQPVSNGARWDPGPLYRQDACPITARTSGMVGMIPTCPHFGADGVTESPRRAAIIANLYRACTKWSRIRSADRIARGGGMAETNTLDGTPAHEAFIKPDETVLLQEFGLAASTWRSALPTAASSTPQAQDGRTGLCDSPNVQGGVNVGGGGLDCSHTVYGRVTSARMSRTPDQRILQQRHYSVRTALRMLRGHESAGQCGLRLCQCDPDGNFVLENVPTGDYKLTVFDQWNDLLGRTAWSRRFTSAPAAPARAQPTRSSSRHAVADECVHAHLPRRR